MPTDITPPQLPDVQIEDEPLRVGGQSISDGVAAERVKRTFFDYENYRRMNHESRWNAADALYCAYLPPKTWEGTKIPKAALSHPVAFYHVETVVPVICQELFGSSDWFQVEPEPGANAAEARAIQAHMLYLLEHDRDDYGRTARREIELAIQSILTYGNGGITINWDPVKKRAVVEWVDLRDIYVDPGTSTPCIDESRAVIQRKQIPLEDLKAMRGLRGMNIPEDGILYHLANKPQWTAGDRTKSMQEAFRGVNFVPGMHDYSQDPAARNIEVLIYYDKSRIIWLLGREWVAFNGENPYGFVPFCFAPCFTYLSRFYAISYCDQLEWAQRYVEALYNGHLNELALSLNPPRVKKAGGLLTPSQERWHPGLVMQAMTPKEDLIVQQTQNVTANIMGDVEYVLEMAEKITGANSMVSGVPRGGNVNRTATGVSSQVQGGSSRIYRVIRNIEDYLIVPMLYKMYKLIQFHTDSKQFLPALGPEDQRIKIGADSFQKPVQFKMLSASRMMKRQELLQVIPVLAQYYLNAPFMQGLHAVGKTVDFEVFDQALQEATGTARRFSFTRDLTPQEKQQISAPPPQAVMEQQQADKELQTRLQLQQMQNQADLQKAQISSQGSPEEMQMEIMKSVMDLKIKQQEMQLDLAKAQQDMQIKQAEMQQKMQLKQMEGQINVQTAAMQSQQDIQHSAESHQHEMAMEKERGSMELKNTENMARIKEKQAAKPKPTTGKK